jgi:vitamin B12 transport system substrate-binding protein
MLVGSVRFIENGRLLVRFPEQDITRNERKTRPLSRRWTGVLLALVALGCGQEPGPELASVTHPPSRIVSLTPELSRVLVELGAAPAIVAADGASRALPELAHAVDLGTLAEADVERALAAGPDVALALGTARATAFAAWLTERGVRAHVLSPRSVNEVDAAVQRLGRLLGRETRALASVARMARRVSQIATARDGRSRLRVVWILERDPLVVVGGVGLLHELLELAGAENAFHEPLEERARIELRELTESAPDLALDSSAAGPRDHLPQGPKRVRVAPRLAEVPALDLPDRVHRLHAALYPAE